MIFLAIEQNLDYNNPYTFIFVVCILFGAFFAYIYWKIAKQQTGVDNWSSNTVSTMIFGATTLATCTLFIIHNPIFPIFLGKKNPHVISVATFYKMIEEPDVLVLDVRNMENKPHISFRKVMILDFYHKNFQKRLNNLPKYKTYLIYCSKV